MDASQKSDVNLIFDDWKNAGNLDYVCCWYKKAADLMLGEKYVVPSFPRTPFLKEKVWQIFGSRSLNPVFILTLHIVLSAGTAKQKLKPTSIAL